MSTNYIDQITDTEGITHDISEGDSTRIFRATCATAAATAAKVATLDTSDRNFSLATGVRVAVTFTYGNTSDSRLTLNVNNTGAKEIHVRTSATSSYQYGSNYNTWGNYETVIFTYDGSKWLNSGSGLMIYNAWNLANSKTANTGTITSVTTTAGTHSTISVSSGAVSFNVPTKTSHLTNDNGYITTDSDENVKSTAVTAATTNYIVGSTTSTTTTGGLSKHASAVMYTTADSSTSGYTQLRLGNTTATSSAGGKEGQIRLYGTNATYYLDLKPGAIASSNKTITFPNKTGTVALTSDIVDEKVKITALTEASTYYLTGNNSFATNTGGLDTHASANLAISGDTSTNGYTRLNLGNSTAGTTAGGREGIIRLYGSSTSYTNLKVSASTSAQTITFPDKSGTVALTSDITGGNYTATSPIDITSDVISHEDSGVTAGTYDGGGVKDSGFYVPSFTVNTTGHVTSATDLGTLIPEVTTSNSSSAVGGVISPLTWSMGLRSYQSSAIVMSAGNTTSSVTISSDSKSGYSYQTYFRVADVHAYDASTYEPVIVDWKADKYYSGGSTITLTISIASAYTNNIIYYPILTYGIGVM